MEWVKLIGVGCEVIKRLLVVIIFFFEVSIMLYVGIIKLFISFKLVKFLNIILCK